MKKNLIDYFHIILKDKKRLFIIILFFLFSVTIPSKLIFNLEKPQAQNPIYQEINVKLPLPQLYPVNINKTPIPYLSARSVIIVDVDSKAVIYAKNPDEKLPPASTTKMITALVAFDEYDLSQIASISGIIHEGQVMELINGEQIRVENLLKGTLIHSANDAALALASIHPQGYDYFIDKMNQKTKEFGLKDSQFTNPNGLQNHTHYSTVHDLVFIGTHLMENPILADMVNTRSEIVTDQSGKIVHDLKAINELLGVVPGLRGIKTGWTEDAGECFVSYTERDGHKIIIAILGSYDRFGETKQLIEWVYNNFQWQEIKLN